jgi:hypothetical protein
MNRTFRALILFGGLLAIKSGQANPCVYPKRLINGHTVEIQPLFNWWGTPKGLRPLVAWKHVQGAISRDSPAGWIVTGKTEAHSQGATFFIKNPPRERLLKFNELKRQVDECKQARDAARAFLQRPIFTDYYSLALSQSKMAPISVTEYRQASAHLGELTHTLNSLNGELAPLQDGHGNFKVDVFALKTEEILEGLPVFDHGSTRAFQEAALSVDPSR